MPEYKIKKITDYKWEIEKDESLGMRVPGIIFADNEILEHARKELVIQQVINVAGLPGIIKASMAMPDIHYGYGFPIGGVAAFDTEQGIISPGGVGFDISCGVRAMRTSLSLADIRDKIEKIMREININIPKGVGSKGKIKLSPGELRNLLKNGVNWAVKNRYGWEEDMWYIEKNGCMAEANPDYVSKEGIDRGLAQVGTLGSGNHFVELQVIDEIYDSQAARIMDLEEDQIMIMIHSGSRGLGHQICGDYIKLMQKTAPKYGIRVPDSQLACAPLTSNEGKKYYASMACAVNYALVNRHCMAHWIRDSFEKIFDKSAGRLGMSTLYDISHNVASIEEHEVDGKKLKVCVHRKGATRAYGPNNRMVPERYTKIGQPVIIPGDMGRYSFILLGTEKAMNESFGSTCHGAGRLMSRAKAKKIIRGEDLKRELQDKKGIVVMAGSMAGLAEEAPQAYKDVSQVVEVTSKAGISKKVARLRPLGVIKG